MARDEALARLRADTAAMRRATLVLRARHPGLSQFWADSATIAEARAELARLYLRRITT